MGHATASTTTATVATIRSPAPNLSVVQNADALGARRTASALHQYRRVDLHMRVRRNQQPIRRAPEL